MLDRRAAQSEASATYFPIKLNSSGVMVRLVVCGWLVLFWRTVQQPLTT